MDQSSRSSGIILVVISALVFSTAGLFSKGINASAWDIIFWRGVFAALFTTAYIFWRGTVRGDFAAMGRSGWAVALVGAAGTAVFIPAFKYTTIANVSLIYAASPFFAGLLAWAWIGERMTHVVLAGCGAALAGVAIIVSGSLGAVNLTGDFLALAMVIAMAIMFVIYRRYPRTPAAGPSVMSSLLLMPLALMFGTPFNNSTPDVTLMAAFGLLFAVASVTLSEGARRLPAGETALLSILEAPVAPVLAWIVFSEMPVFATLLGGMLVMAGVVGAQIFSKAEV
jgi:drug/metabolite transporter (DMT)-like permease